MTITALAFIQLRGMQFSSDSRLTDLITLAGSRFDATAFGDRYNEAVGLLVMHWLAKEQAGGGSESSGSSGVSTPGAVVSESEGELSRSYSVDAQRVERYGDLTTTGYGQELIDLIRTECGFAALTRMMT